MTVARKNEYTIALLPGDGIGPEIVEQARRVLVATAELAGVKFTFEEGLIGGAAIDATGTALPDDTTAICKRADAVLLGAVGGPKWDNPSAKVRPEQGLLQGARVVRQPASRRAASVAGERVAAATGAARGGRSARGARAHGRDLFR